MKTSWSRASVAVIAAGFASVAVAGPAAAEETFPFGGVANIDTGYTLQSEQGDEREAPVVTVRQESADGAVLAYSLRADTDVDGEQRIYEETGWDDSGVSRLGLVRSILQDGYPGADAGSLADAAGADLAGLTDSGKVAYAATQAAIWEVTDDFTLDTDATDQNAVVDAAVTTIARYLVDNAEKASEVTNEVTVDGPDTGAADGNIGPYTAKGPRSDGSLLLSVDNGQPVDAAGETIKKIGPGEEFYIDPDSGSDEVTLTVSADHAPPPGLALSATDRRLDGDDKVTAESAALVLAESGPGETATEMDVAIGANSDGDVLPVTGSAGGALLTLGLGLALVGACFLVFAGRGRTA